MRSWREPKALIIQPIRCQSDGNMADILSESTKPEHMQVIHSRTARSLDEGQALSGAIFPAWKAVKQHVIQALAYE